MIIEVIFDGRHLTITPDPAHARVGEDVDWLMLASDPSHRSGQFASLHWEVYFDHGSPFIPPLPALQVTTRFDPPVAMVHRGMVKAGRAQRPGDYKYGVRLFSSASRDPLEDEDPNLLITP